MTDRFSIKKTISKKLGNLFKTDIPPMVQSKPGNTVKKKNFVYISGPSTWKAKARAKAADDGNLSCNVIDSISTLSQTKEYCVQRGNNPSSAAVPADVYFTVEQPGTRDKRKHTMGEAHSNQVNGLPNGSTPNTAISSHHSYVLSRDSLSQQGRGHMEKAAVPQRPTTMITSTTLMVTPNVSRQSSFQV